MTYQKPTVTIELDEYNELKQKSEANSVDIEYDEVYSVLISSYMRAISNLAGNRNVLMEAIVKRFNEDNDKYIVKVVILDSNQPMYKFHVSKK